MPAGHHPADVLHFSGTFKIYKMNRLKRNIALACFKRMSSPSKTEILREIKPYAAIYNLTLSDTRIGFPDDISEEQALIHSLYESNLYRHGIPYNAILEIRDFGEEVCLLLRTGHLFIFAKGSSVWRIRDLYNYGEPSGLQLWTWKLRQLWADLIRMRTSSGFKIAENKKAESSDR